MKRFRLNFVESLTERIIYASRWAQAPIYLGMVVVTVFYAFIFCREVYQRLSFDMTERDMMLFALSLLDISMVINLIVIVIIGGYWGFVSRMEVIERDKDASQFGYLGSISPNALKLKLMVSLLSISAVHLLETLLHHEEQAWPQFGVQLAIHFTFLFTCIGMVLLDRIQGVKGH